MRTSFVLLDLLQSRLRVFAVLHTSTAHVLRVARIEELQLLLDSGTTCRLVFYEKKPRTHSDLINPVDSVEPLAASVRGVKAIRSVARLDVIAF